ncbi:MAG: bi-domain-containing oxidoreductase [Verrucomicrobiaceae bacterium]
MKQLAQYQDGRLELQEVPAPVPPPGGILVRTTCSVISPGTERMKVEQARMSLLQKAKARPDQVKKVLDTARTLGWKAAMEKVRNRLESPTPLGYSAAGVVVAVDELNTRFRVGDRVACGGAECAHHAEMIAVPDLLAAPIPEGVEDWQAAYTTLASISMEAVRQSSARLGERVLVIGQGLVGLLATSLLKASGARVMASDFVGSRLNASRQMGAERVVNPSQAKLENEVREWTNGHGADAVLLCVGGKGREAADAAIACLRDRGVMVIVGIYDAELSWKTAYMKDIQVRYSRSYGPGRYDPQYEWGGQDYPIGHVRWTENRNFEACLELMRTGQLDLKSVTTRKVAFGDALEVYNKLESELGVVIEYGVNVECGMRSAESKPDQFAAHHSAFRISPSALLDVIGAGNFARTMLLPHVKGKIAFGTVVNATGLSARHVKEKFGFANAETDAAKVLGCDTGCQPVGSGQAGSLSHAAALISTRHHLHAPLVLKALQSGKQVFVEKPLCLTREELAQIDDAMKNTGGSVMVGFNRRFAPATVAMMEALKSVSGPKTLAFHVNAGVLAPDHWYANVAESGGRVLGEACHFFDFACHVLGRPVKVTAQTVGRPKVPDSVTAQIEFADGSSAQVIYSAEGDSAFPKESFRVFANGLVVECENFMKLSIFRRRKETVKKFTSKGHAEEMAAWLAFLKDGAPHPLPYEQSRQSMCLTFAVLDSIREGRSIELG